MVPYQRFSVTFFSANKQSTEVRKYNIYSRYLCGQLEIKNSKEDVRKQVVGSATILIQ